MKIDINTCIEMEFAETMAACLESVAKKKETEEVNTLVEQSFKSADLESLNAALWDLEHDNDYMTYLTREQMSTHEDQLWKLRVYSIIDANEWDERAHLIMNAWHSQHEAKLDGQTE